MRSRAGSTGQRGERGRIAIIEVGGSPSAILRVSLPGGHPCQFQHDVGHENAVLVHVTLIPYLKASEELKTKPTQASVKELQGMGLQPGCSGLPERISDSRRGESEDRLVLQRAGLPCAPEPGCGIFI